MVSSGDKLSLLCLTFLLEFCPHSFFGQIKKNVQTLVLLVCYIFSKLFWAYLGRLRFFFLPFSYPASQPKHEECGRSLSQALARYFRSSFNVAIGSLLAFKISYLLVFFFSFLKGCFVFGNATLGFCFSTVDGPYILTMVPTLNFCCSRQFCTWVSKCNIKL